MDRDLREEMLAMVGEADRLRTALARTGELYQGYPADLADLNGRHALRLEEIVASRGWPGRSAVGDDGADAAWLIAQHAIAHPRFQRLALVSLRSAVAAGEARPAHAAFLEDKIAFLEGKPQRYGTQFDWDEHGSLSPCTLADPDHVDELRRSVGLNTLAERTAEMRATAESPPADRRKHREEGEAWARAVGWR